MEQPREAREAIEKAVQHHHHPRASFENDSPIALGVNLEEKWESNHHLDRHSTGESSSIEEPEKTKAGDGHGKDAGTGETKNHDLEGAPVRRVVTAQDWTGPDDPENPHNWPMWKRVWHTVPPALFAFVV